MAKCAACYGLMMFITCVYSQGKADQNNPGLQNLPDQAKAEENERRKYPEEFSGQMDGDIKMSREELDARIEEIKKLKQRRRRSAGYGDYYGIYYDWTDGQIHYYFDSAFAALGVNYGNYTHTPKQVAEAAFDIIESVSCVRFVPADGSKPYVKIIYGQGCYSEVGMMYKYPQELSLGYMCTYNIWTVVHELMHLGGFYHEHSRPDMPDYAQYIGANVMPDQAHNFNQISCDIIDCTEPYDCDSIMHYGPLVWSIDKATPKKTLNPDAANHASQCANIGQRSFLSQGDINKLKKMYGTPGVDC